MLAFEYAQYTSVGVTINVLDLNETEISAFPNVVSMVNFIKSKFTLIEQWELIAGRDDTGVSMQKEDMRLLLEAKGHRIGRAIYSWAMSENRKDLAQPMDDSLSSLQKLKDGQLAFEMSRYLEFAEDNAADLLDWGVLAADITDFELAITTFNEWKFDPRTATAQRKTASYEVSVNLRLLMKYLKERMDPVMYLFEGSGTSFYGDYFNARIIVDPAGPDAETQTGINPIETDTIINLPFTNLGAGKEVRIKCLTPGTNFEIYCSNAPSVPPTGTPLSINDVISPIYTTTDDLGWLPDSPYVNIHFPPLPVQIEWEVRVG